MNAEQIQTLDSIRSLCRAGAGITGERMGYNESTSGKGWTHITVTIHQHNGDLTAWYVQIDPEGRDGSTIGGNLHIALDELHERLIEHIAKNRREAA